MIKKGFFTLFLLGLSYLLPASSFIYLYDLWDSTNRGFDYFSALPVLEDKGIHFLTSFIFDLNWPTRGGIKTTSYPLNQYLLDVQFGFETQPLLKIKGGRAFMCFQYHQSQHPSLEYVGDYQGFDNINSPNLTQIGELWYSQTFFNQKLALKLGKIDAYLHFNYSQFAQILLNNSFSQNPTILGFPSYPNQAVGIVCEYFPKPYFSLRASLFDGSNANGVQTGSMGARLFFNRLGEHALFLNQMSFHWDVLSNQKTGTLGLGFWGLTNQLPNFEGDLIHGTVGAYAFLWQTLFKEIPTSSKRPHKNQRELGGFLQWGSCSKEVSPIDVYLGAGLTFKNFARSFQDAFSVGVATTLFSNAKGSPFINRYEMALEGTYQFNFYGYFQAQPDFQYIIHPGGNGNKNAIVVTLRLVTSL